MVRNARPVRMRCVPGADGLVEVAQIDVIDPTNSQRREIEVPSKDTFPVWIYAKRTVLNVNRFNQS
jgi:hypothetical protein